MTIRCCALVPVYNHEHAVGSVVAALRAHDLPVLLIDDGSHAACGAVLDALAASDPSIRVLRRTRNGGKGAAMRDGFEAAHRAGYSHALQIDADGQHDTDDVPRFLAAARQQPDAVICGHPQFDASVPKARLYGRYATHVWVWINTLSLRIVDSMCGFRIYPLERTTQILATQTVGKRMDFDTEILVRLDWAGVAIVNLLTQVRYPLDGISHFRPWRDNLAISRMHTRLFFGMLWRAPRLLARHLGRKAAQP